MYRIECIIISLFSSFYFLRLLFSDLCHNTFADLHTPPPPALSIYHPHHHRFFTFLFVRYIYHPLSNIQPCANMDHSILHSSTFHHHSFPQLKKSTTPTPTITSTPTTLFSSHRDTVDPDHKEGRLLYFP